MSDQAGRVAIIGGGFSGAMLAARLAERGLASVVINRTADIGLGVAYSTPFDGHLLNVRSGRMSAIDARADDFVVWLAAHYPEHADPEGFVPRRLYGLYVQDRLASVEAAHPGLIERIVGEAAAVGAEDVVLSDGRRIAALSVVLATGNPAPRTTRGAKAEKSVISDPWAPGVLERIGADDDVLILGTGLTMVDMLLTLEGRGWKGRATALSRRGLLPRAHLAAHDTAAAPTPDMLDGPLSQRAGAARRLADASSWRGMMEGLRPITADLWSAADMATRGRMVRHLRPWWDVHRHRIADRIAAVLDRLTTEGRLRLVAGRVRGIEDQASGVTLRWSPRHAVGDEAVAPLSARWLIDCTGPGHDPASDPLTGPLLASGRARLDPLRLGLDLDARGRVRHADGASNPALFVLGPPARAAFWETIAVPDIRKRIEDVAQALAERTPV